MNMKKKIAVLVVLAGIAGLALPVMNLFVPPPPTKLASFTSDDAETAKVGAILSAKCAICHSENPTLPLYGRLPIAKQLMTYDITTAVKHADYVSELMGGKPVSEAALAKLEYVVEAGNMPPPHYLIMHWNHLLNADEKATLKNWARSMRAKLHAPAGIPENLKSEVLQPLPDSVDANPAKVALGDKLFHDKRLSKDDTIACASCHGLDKGGTDQSKFSTGVGGQMGDINAPTVYNSGFQFIQFWDGRAANLAEQADGPVNNPVEMASNWDEVTAKLSQDPEMTQAFLAVYPDGYKKDNYVDAIAEFERTLITPSAYDRFLKGDKAALAAEQQRGLETFKEIGCSNCHCGSILGGKSFELMGLRDDYFGDRGNVHKPDYGRFNVTQKEGDRFRVKVPTLRNIKITFPYFHDSSTDDLGKAVEVMAKYQSGVTLTAQQKDDIVKFLESLTGEYKGQQLK